MPRCQKKETSNGGEVMTTELPSNDYVKGWGDGYDAFEGGAIKIAETAVALERERIVKVLRKHFPSNRAGYIVGEKTLIALFAEIEGENVD